MQKKTFTTEFGNKTLTAEFTDLTERAHGSVLLRYGETVVLVTAVMGKADNSGLPYFPLSVEFEEKFYAAGQILGSRFMRREGKPSDEAILSARIIDRTIRPLFPADLRIEVQVVVSVLAVGSDDPDILGVLGASLALGVSDIPWNGPVSVARVCLYRDGKTIINPTYEERARRDVQTELLACGQDGHINMIEAASFEQSEAEIVTLLKTASLEHTALQKFQQTIIAELGKDKRILPTPTIPEELTQVYESKFKARLLETLFCGIPGKDHLSALTEDFVATASTELPNINPKQAASYFETKIDEELHRGAVLEGKRADLRGLDEVRELYAEAGGISPVLHGSGIFYRGGTKIFSALTLGGPEAALMIDTMEEQSQKKRFLHHYNFPPFSVGETGRVGGFNRRMIGHGALAEKALIPVIPPLEIFPYTIRLVSETFSSNGSSSMGSVCASSLALMDGGVPISRPVAGIASGVMFYGDRYALLTDIQGPEDEFGDMDFKVAGTTSGITAIQMDVKVAGISPAILGEALEKARLARLTILETMNKALAAPRTEISPRAPHIVSLTILPEQIGLVIGSGGKTITSIKETTGVTEITIEDDGTVFINGTNTSTKQAALRIQALTRQFLVGEQLSATITKITTFGAFAKLNDYTEGLIHISEVAPFRIENLDRVLSVGQIVPVIITKIESGKIGLSILQADPAFIPKPNP